MTTLLLIGFALAVLMGAGCAAVLAQMRPQWSGRRKVLAAASVLPAVMLLTSAIGLLWIAAQDYPGGGDMRDLAIRAIGLLGGGFALLAFVGGIIGAGLARLRRAR